MLLGIDEVGRGPFAGPLVLAGVVMPTGHPDWCEELRDSKKLSKKRRELFAEKIKSTFGYGLGFVSAGEIDRLGLTEALDVGVMRVMKDLQNKHVEFDKIIIDGNLNLLAGTRWEKITTTLIKGDDLIKEISAASIIAKVARDDYMTNLAEVYPGYGFEKHMGYGAKAHRDAMVSLGLCPEHRRLVKGVKKIALDSGEDLSYLFSNKAKKNTTLFGNRGEDQVAEYLEQNGHEIICRNFKTKIVEIDIVSRKDEKIYFTEVKYRRDDEHGGGIAAVNQAKLEQMRLGVNCFLKLNPRFSQLDPLLAVGDVTGEDYVVKNWFEIY